MAAATAKAATNGPGAASPGGRRSSSRVVHFTPRDYVLAEGDWPDFYESSPWSAQRLGGCTSSPLRQMSACGSPRSVTATMPSVDPDLLIPMGIAAWLLVRALGYAEEPGWLRWSALGAIIAALCVTWVDWPDWAFMVCLAAWLVAMVGHLIWVRNWKTQPWSIPDAARRGALFGRAEGVDR